MGANPQLILFRESINHTVYILAPLGTNLSTQKAFMEVSVEDSREKARVTEHHIENTAYTKYPGNYHGFSDEWNLLEFINKTKVEIVSYENGRELELDIIGIGPAIANAYRRIMIAEVPTMAIEHVFIYNNTSVIQDEMLSHRLGLIPIKADPTLFSWKPPGLGPENTSREHTLVFKLRAKCKLIDSCDPDTSGRREDLYKDYKVFSGHLKWEPLKEQETRVSEVKPVYKKILLAKLSGKQEIDFKLHAIKGIGRDHAKFSPVATVSYRLMPAIRLTSKISGEAAERLKESFSEGVIELTGKERIARVSNARLDSGSRNIFRQADLKDKVVYDLKKDHFIFRIESTGCIPAIDIFLQSCSILESKCQYFLEALQTHRSRVNELAPVVEGV